MTRKETNTEILKFLIEANERWHDLRFGQLLLMTGITVPIEDLYKESTTILEKMKGENNGKESN